MFFPGFYLPNNYCHYETEFNAQIELGKTLREIGSTQEAMDLFSSMRNEDKNSDKFDVVDLQIGLTYASIDEYEEAVNQLVRVDTTYANTLSAGEARYNLGESFQYNLNNFDSAQVYYQKASTLQAPLEISLSATDEMRKFRKYSQFKTEISQNRQKLIYALDPDQFTKDSTTYFEELAEQQAQTEANNQSQTDFGDRRNRDLNTEEDSRSSIPTPNKNTQTKKNPPQKPNISVTLSKF